MAHSSKNRQAFDVCGSVARSAVHGHGERTSEGGFGCRSSEASQRMSQVVCESFLEKGDFQDTLYCICMYNLIYLFMAVLGRCCCVDFSLQGLPLLESIGPRHTGSAAVVHWLGCSTACGIFPNQGSNPCVLHWQAFSSPQSQQGNPDLFYFFSKYLLSTYSVSDTILDTENKPKNKIGR